jgi:hypothetical protein
MSLQDELNRIAGTSNLTNKECLNILATGLAGIDQSQVGTANTTRLGEVANKYIGQAFLPTKKDFTGVVFRRSTNDGTYVGDVTVEIRTETSSSPSSTVLATTTIPNATWNGYTVNTDVTLSMPLTLTVDGSTKYWIVFTSSTADSVNFTRLINQASSTYTNGATKLSADGISWGADSGNDCYFKTLYTDFEKDSIDCANSWAGTTNQTIQDAINLRAGRDLTTQELLSKQDAAKLI